MDGGLGGRGGGITGARRLAGAPAAVPSPAPPRRSDTPWPTDRSASSECSRSPSARRTRSALRRLWIDLLGLDAARQLPERARERRRGHRGRGRGSLRRRGRPDAADRSRTAGRASTIRRSITSVSGSTTSPPPSSGSAGRACASRRAASARAPRASTSASSTPRGATMHAVGGEGVLIELVQAPPEVIEAHARVARDADASRFDPHPTSLACVSRCRLRCGFRLTSPSRSG